MSIWAIRHKRFFPACAMALMVAMVATAARAEPRRLALVIGNSLYARMPIIAPCASAANVVAGALKRAGFEVTQLANVSNGQMGSAMGGFAEAIGKSPDTIAVAYLCGYTIVFDGRVFLLPASTNLMRETDVLTQGIVSRVLINTIVRSNARAGLVLLDNMTVPGTDAALPLDGLVDPATLGSKGFAATQNRGQMREGPTPFATALVAGFAAPAIDVRAMLRELRASLPATPQLAVIVQEPAEPAWLSGPLSSPPPATPPLATPPLATVAPPTINLPSVSAPAVTSALAAPISPPVTLPPAASGPNAPAPSVPGVTAALPGAPMPTDPTTTPTARSSEPAVLNPADMRRVQLALQRLGYYAGKVDGVVGPDTLAAIRRFQNEMRVAMTGRLTKDQADRLLAVGF